MNQDHPNSDSENVSAADNENVGDESVSDESAHDGSEQQTPDQESADTVVETEAPEEIGAEDVGVRDQPRPDGETSDASESGDAEPEEAEPEQPPMRWYVLKVQSNREKSIRLSILRRIKMEDMEEFFGEIVIPTEKIVETKAGSRRVREQKMLPGYMMIQMDLNDETWHLVRSTSGVGDFTGAAGKPIAMEDEEVRRWLGGGEEKPGEKKKEEEAAKPVVKFDVAVGDHVKVKDGPFDSFEGTVDDLDDLTGKVKVIVEIFSRPTEVELEHWQVEKM